jgi:hypothetical protein
MRLLTLPIVAVGVLAVPGSDEPSAGAMRRAFEATLAAQVRSALAFVAETGGEAALARVRAARTDAFDIRAFTKLDCVPGAPGRGPRGHVCGFAVRIGVAGGELGRTLTGRFHAGPRGLVFEDADAAGV